MAHTPRVLTLPEVGEASAELVSDDFPVLHWQHVAVGPTPNVLRLIMRESRRFRDGSAHGN